MNTPCTRPTPPQPATSFRRCYGDCVAACVAGGGFLWLLLYGIPAGIDMPETTKGAGLLPDFWPRCIAIFGLMASVLLMLLSGVRRWRQQRTCTLGCGQTLRHLGMFVWLGAYLWSIPLLGLWLSSAIFLPVTSFLYGERTLWRLVLLTGIMLSVLQLFFACVANVQLPQGMAVLLGSNK